MAYNVVALGAVADFGAKSCQVTTKADARCNVELTTKTAIVPNACYQQPFFQSKLKFKTMIQGKEIKIGNYLKDRGGKVLRVDFVEYVEDGFDTKFGQKMFVEGQEVHPMTEYSDYAEPIILNEEWLLKLGFTKYSTGSWCKNLKNDDSYLAIDVKYGNGTWLNINQEGQENTIKLIHIKNVHELQNLYYALTGVELSAS